MSVAWLLLNGFPEKTKNPYLIDDPKYGLKEGGTMNLKFETVCFTALAFFMVLILGAYSAPAFDLVTIVGEVNVSNQIVSEGEIYEIDDTPQGDDLVKNYIGQKVKVTGKLRIEGDMRILEVTKFEMAREVL